MATLSTRRYSKPAINGSMRVGKPPSRIATESEHKRLSMAIALLKDASETTTINHFNYNVSEVFKTMRDIIKQRNS